MDEHRPVVTLPNLGQLGGFGNQFFQYAFIKIYAKVFHLRVETSGWKLGRYLFGRGEPPIIRRLPTIYEREIASIEDMLSETGPRYKDVNFDGYFLLHMSCYAPYKEYLRSLFKPVPGVEAVVRKGLDRLQAKGNTIIGLHLRRGDFLALENHAFYNQLFYAAPTDWYTEWLKTIWHTVDRPVLFIASDEPDTVLGDFSEFGPVTSRELCDEDLPKARFYPDFYLLSQCDIMAISNSTFSYAASLLNERAESYLRPDLRAKGLIAYDPWDSQPLLNYDIHLHGRSKLKRGK